MEALLNKLMLLRNQDEKGEASKARKRALAAVGAILGTIAACVIGYVVFSTISNTGNGDDQFVLQKINKPDMFLCSGDTEPPLEALRRARRQIQRGNGNANANSATLIKRVPRPLSLPPPSTGLNFSYNPPLYHDAGARCAWGHLSNKRVPHLEDVGVSYDFQQLEARSCDDPEECKSMCLRMHKTDDPYLCNYFTWHRQKKLALFYFLEPTLKWNLTEDNRVETFFWQCRETQCSWYWRPHRVWTHLSELTSAQLRKAQGLLAVTQCADFASCQFSCETRPSFKELGVGAQIPEGANPEDPSCAYVMMPSKGTQNRESFLFSMPQTELKNVSYRGSSFYDSFELVCQDAVTTPRPTIQQTSTPLAPVPAASQTPAAAPPPPPPPAATQPPPPPAPVADTQSNVTSIKKRQKRETNLVNILDQMKMRECRSSAEKIDCSRMQLIDSSRPSECVRLNNDLVSKSDASMTIETKNPLWLVLQTSDHEQSVRLTPGLRHTIDIAPSKSGLDSDKNCGPPHLRHRRCTTTCQDRSAVDACGCTLTPDADQASAALLLSVPLCDEQRLRSCVHPHLERASDAYFDCVKECKRECQQKPYSLRNRARSLDENKKDLVEMNLSYSGSTRQSIDSRPIEQGNKVVYVWMPVTIVAVLLLALVFCYCAQRLV